MKVQCPSCDQWLQIPGRAATCPNCGTLVTAAGQAVQRRPKGQDEPVFEDEPGGYVPPSQYEPADNRPLLPAMPTWARAVAIIAVVAIGAFGLLLFAVNQVVSRFSATPAPAVAPPPPPPAPPKANPQGSQLFTFADPAKAPAPPPPPAPAPPTVQLPATTSAVNRLFSPVPLAPAQADTITDEAINAAIIKGANYLISRFQDGKFLGEPNEHHAGAHALVLLGLMHAGEAIHDERLNVNHPFMSAALNALRQLPVPPSVATYTRSLRAQALAFHNRKEDRLALDGDTRWLIASSVRGAYGYDAPPSAATQPNAINWDNSNAQYGVLGVWAAADAGISVPLSYWLDVQYHWERTQATNGGWDYKESSEARTTLSMTSAGVNMLFVANEMISEQRPSVQIARPPFSPSLQAGLDWMSKGDNAIKYGGHYAYYTLYGMERAGLASGFKTFGKHDWFRVLAADVLKNQAENGAWTNEVDTAFALLFLARGRHPLLMNKLHFLGAWANRPRDVRHLAKFTSRETERPLNWQVVQLASDPSEWLDAPILYLSSHEAPIFDESDFAKLKRFVDAGGILFTHADGGSKEFSQWAELVAMKLFAGREMKELPRDHFVYNALFKPKPEEFPLRAVSSNTRLLMLHSPTDISGRWQGKTPKADRAVFELGANLFIYATGMQVPRNRVDTLHVPEAPAPAAVTIPIARLKHAGEWDPEPFAWTRAGRMFRQQTSAALRPVTTEIEKLSTRVAPVAHLTSTTPFALTDPQIAALRKYVDAGGVLLIDASGGGKPVADSIRANVLARAFAGKEPQVMRTDHPLLAGSGPGMTQIAKPVVRPYVTRRMGQQFPKTMLLESGKGAVIINELDVTSGLLGTNTLGILGFDPAYAYALTRNAILWSVNERGLKPAWTATTTTAPTK